MVAGMRKAGAECRLVSGGFKYFTSRIAERLDFNGDQANDIEVLDGKLTGRVLDPILDKHAKLATLRALAAELSISLDDAVTVGDGANDLPMLEAAGLGVAWRAKPSVAASVPGPGSTMAISRRCCSSSDWTPADASGMLANNTDIG